MSSVCVAPDSVAMSTTKRPGAPSVLATVAFRYTLMLLSALHLGDQIAHTVSQATCTAHDRNALVELGRQPQRAVFSTSTTE